MTTYDAETFSIGTAIYKEELSNASLQTFVISNPMQMTQLSYAEKPILITLTGSGINPIPIYFLAMFDSLGIRRYWLDTYPSINGAPTLGGGSTYDTSTFVILGRY